MPSASFGGMHGLDPELMENRELNLDDYLGILNRRKWLVIIPVLVAPLLGFLASYAVPAKYTSQSTVLVEGQRVPEGYVKPVVTDALAQRIATLQQQVLSSNRLLGMIDRLNLPKPANTDELLDSIRQNVEIKQVQEDLSPAEAKAERQKKGPNASLDVPGFNVRYTDPNPRTAQRICNELTSMVLEENLKSREQVAQSTTDFLSRQLEDAKKNIDDQDAKLAAFKRQYLGQLPGDEETNLKILTGMNSQLEAITQAVNRNQQDKAYAESLLAQELNTLKKRRTAPGQARRLWSNNWRPCKATCCACSPATPTTTRMW